MKCSNCKENWENGSGSDLCNACTKKGLSGQISEKLRQDLKKKRSETRQKRIKVKQDLIHVWIEVEKNWDLLKSGGSGAVAQTKLGKFHVCTHDDGNNSGGYISLNGYAIDWNQDDVVNSFIQDARSEFPCPCRCGKK